MKEKIRTLRCYNLLNEDGRALRLYLGRYENHAEAMMDYGPDKGYRWMFEGGQIPMPVRSDTWFNGFPEAIMLNWLKENGWALHTTVDMHTGHAFVYELPFHDEPSKGNENPTEAYQLTDEAIRRGKVILKEAIRLLCNNGSVLSAVALYRYVHPCSLVEAKHAVDAIRFDNAP